MKTIVKFETNNITNPKEPHSIHIQGNGLNILMGLSAIICEIHEGLDIPFEDFLGVVNDVATDMYNIDKEEEHE